MRLARTCRAKDEIPRTRALEIDEFITALVVAVVIGAGAGAMAALFLTVIEAEGLVTSLMS
jgi:hypothetical protein